MSGLYSSTIFHWFTTPKELREIADKMEREWPKLVIGDSNVLHLIHGKDSILQIQADQDRMSK